MALLSLSRILAHWAAQDPDVPAISFEEKTLTRQELDLRTNRLARAYAARGVKQDDLVTIALPNSIEFMEAAFAVWKLGATPQPISSRLPRIERDQIIEVGNPSLVVGIDEAAAGSIASVPVGFEAPAELDDSELPERTARYLKAMTSGGSTGRPKLIVSELPGAFDPDAEFFGFRQNGAMLIPGPLYHNGPFLFSAGALFKGNHVAVMPRFDAEQTLNLIDEIQADTVYLVPTMMLRIWNLPEEVRLKYRLSSLQAAWHLAAPCPPWLKEAWIDWLGPERIFELYGGTEGQGFTVITGTEWLQHRGSVGKPMPSCQMKIVGDNGETLPAGEIGEVYIIPETGQGSTYHYIGDKAKEIDGGWESLGDLGYMDEDGYLYLTDRQTDMILSGGANIYPAEIEGAIESYPGVHSCAVIGLPDEDMGNKLHAIVYAPGQTIQEEQLVDHLNERLVRYKVPRQFEFLNEPVRDEAGKVRRKALRQERVQS